jgi:hypothetical protein
MRIRIAYDAERETSALRSETNQDMEEDEGISRTQSDTTGQVPQKHEYEEDGIEDEEDESRAAFSIESHGVGRGRGCNQYYCRNRR